MLAKCTLYKWRPERPEGRQLGRQTGWACPARTMGGPRPACAGLSPPQQPGAGAPRPGKQAAAQGGDLRSAQGPGDPARPCPARPSTSRRRAATDTAALGGFTVNPLWAMVGSVLCTKRGVWFVFNGAGSVSSAFKLVPLEKQSLGRNMRCPQTQRPIQASLWGVPHTCRSPARH